MTEQSKAFEGWAIVELFGHNTVAGYMTEQSIGGGAFIRIDVPAVNEDHPAFTKFYGDKAVYAITPVSEEVAKAAIQRLQVRPVSSYVLPVPSSNRQLVDSHAQLDDEDELDGDGNDEDGWKKF